MVAGPGAAYICDTCLALCNDIIDDPAPFSEKALELASRPPVVIAAPQVGEVEPGADSGPREPWRTVNVELEQKQQGMILLLHQIQFFDEHFEIHYLWIRPPLTAGFAFIPRIIFFARDNTGKQWTGDRGGMLLARPELISDPNHAVYQGSARFRPLPSSDARLLTIRAADPLAQFEDIPARPWHFEVTI